MVLCTRCTMWSGDQAAVLSVLDKKIKQPSSRWSRPVSPHVQEEEVGFPSRHTSTGQTGQHSQQERQKESVCAADWTRHVTRCVHTTTAVQLYSLFHPVLAIHLSLSLYPGVVRGWRGYSFGATRSISSRTGFASSVIFKSPTSLDPGAKKKKSCPETKWNDLYACVFSSDCVFIFSMPLWCTGEICFFFFYYTDMLTSLLLWTMVVLDLRSPLFALTQVTFPLNAVIEP